MDFKTLTVDEIVETLPDNEKAEVLRDDFRIPLQIYLDAFNSGTFAHMRQTLLNRFRLFAKNRAGVRNEIARNLDVAKTPVDSPLVIIGMPRSGTTLLQRLLSSDPQFVSPMMWEMILSVPPGRPEKWHECKRYKQLQEMKEYKALASGSFDHVHKLRLELDAECLCISQSFFIDTVEPLGLEILGGCRNFMYNCPEDHVKNFYEFHKMCLKCMFYGNLTPGKSLLLKASVHLLHLEAMRREYPNAKFIYPYRNLKSVIGSLASFKSKVLQFMNLKEDHHGVGHRSMEYIKQCASRLVQSLKKWPEYCYINIAYTDLVNDPMGTVRKIYSKFDLVLTPAAEDAIQCYLQENPQNKHGRHDYSLEQFGITDEDVKNNFAEYLEYFRNGNEKLL